jgi:hypothetical protein
MVFLATTGCRLHNLSMAINSRRFPLPVSIFEVIRLMRGALAVFA